MQLCVAIKCSLCPPLVVLPLSFPPVKAPLKVLAPPASPSGISSRLIRALGRGCLYTWNTWPPSLSSAALLSTKASSNRKTWSRWQMGQTQSKLDMWFYRSHCCSAETRSLCEQCFRNITEGIARQWHDTRQYKTIWPESIKRAKSVSANRWTLPGPCCSWVLRGSKGSGTAGSPAVFDSLPSSWAPAGKTDTQPHPSFCSPPPRCTGPAPAEQNHKINALWVCVCQLLAFRLENFELDGSYEPLICCNVIPGYWYHRVADCWN